MTAFARALPQPTTARALGAGIASCRVLGDAQRQVQHIGSLASTAPDLLAFCDDANPGDRLGQDGRGGRARSRKRRGIAP